MTTEEAKKVADTILAQLGGSRFIAMTGCKHFTHDDKGTLSFQLAKARKGFKMSGVRIELNAMDTYDVRFVDMRRDLSMVTKDKHGIYADQLQAIFTAETGLLTHL